MDDVTRALRLDARPDGTIVAVRAAPGASRERIVGVHGDALKIAVSAPPEKGKANERIVAVLAAALAVAPRAIELHTGATARDKRFLVHGLDVATVRDRLRAALAR